MTPHTHDMIYFEVLEYGVTLPTTGTRHTPGTTYQVPGTTHFTRTHHTTEYRYQVPGILHHTHATHPNTTWTYLCIYAHNQLCIRYTNT